MGEKKPKAADVLLEIASVGEFFHCDAGTAYAILNVDDHVETWPVRSKGYKQWLAHRYYQRCGTAANSDAVQSALTTIEGMARFDGPLSDVYVRVGEHDGDIFIDLGDEAWRAVRISKSGWDIVAEVPVHFRRPNGLLPLAPPVRGFGDLNTLKQFLNLKDDDQFELVKAWLCAAVRPLGPYPILVFTGEQGSAKSTALRMLRKIIDPNKILIKSFPREERDLFISTTTNHVIAIDNVSRVSPNMSDSLCRLSTGGGFATRQLHTDSDEIIIDAQRPIALNGIGDFLDRQDARDRAILVELEPIPDDKRRTEEDLWRDFDAKLPSIRAGLYDAVVEGLNRSAYIQMDKIPRMADFAKWAEACETSHSDPGSFQKAYDDNREDSVATAIDLDEVADGVCQLMEERQEWTGTATDLLTALTEQVNDTEWRAKSLPKSATALSVSLKRSTPNLRDIGIEITRPPREGSERRRIIEIRKLPESASAASTSSASPDASDGRNADLHYISEGASP